jgi:hypothetical protein
VAERQRAADIEAKHDRLHEAFRQLQFELELLKRRLFHAKAERIDTGQLELEFAAKLAALDTLAGQLQSNEAPAGPAEGASKDDPSEGGPSGSKRKTQQRRGRRDFNELDLPEERIEVPDLELDGKVERIGTEDSSKVMWRRGGFWRVVLARIKYKPSVKLEEVAVEPEGPSTIGSADGDAPADDLAAIEPETDMPAGAVADAPESPSSIGPVTDGDRPADDLAAVPTVADMPTGTIADAVSPTIADATAIPVSRRRRWSRTLRATSGVMACRFTAKRIDSSGSACRSTAVRCRGGSSTPAQPSEPPSFTRCTPTRCSTHSVSSPTPRAC